MTLLCCKDVLDRAQHGHDLAEHLGVVTQNGLEVGVAGEQPSVAVTLPEHLDGGLGVEHRCDDVTVLGGFLLTYDYPVTVANRGVYILFAEDLEI